MELQVAKKLLSISIAIRCLQNKGGYTHLDEKHLKITPIIRLHYEEQKCVR